MRAQLLIVTEVLLIVSPWALLSICLYLQHHDRLHRNYECCNKSTADCKISMQILLQHHGGPSQNAPPGRRDGRAADVPDIIGIVIMSVLRNRTSAILRNCSIDKPVFPVLLFYFPLFISPCLAYLSFCSTIHSAALLSRHVPLSVVFTMALL